MLGRIFASLGHYFPWASPDYLLDRMTIEQVFHYYDMAVWNETDKVPAKYEGIFSSSKERKYKMTEDGKLRVIQGW